jgi:hypothetical protein
LTKFEDIQASFARLILADERLRLVQFPGQVGLAQAGVESHLP